MPKSPKQNITHVHKYPSGLKKTHCIKNNNNYYNQKQSEFLINQPEFHWTKDPHSIYWEYYILITNQIHIASVQFRETRDWIHYYNLQRSQHILRTLINDSVNVTLLNPDQVRELNETIGRNFEQMGKTN